MAWTFFSTLCMRGMQSWGMDGDKENKKKKNPLEPKKKTARPINHHQTVRLSDVIRHITPRQTPTRFFHDFFDEF